MAKITFKNTEKYYKKLQTLEEMYATDRAIEQAVYPGAGIVADAIRKNLEALPEEPFRHLQAGEMFHGLPKGQKEDLLAGFGVSPARRSREGFVHVKLGWDDYGSYPTETYPYGVPDQLLAGAVESGSSVRKKTPFIRPAVKATRQKAIDAMEEAIDAQIEKIFEGE